MDEWIKMEQAMEILGLSYSGVYYRQSIGLLETRKERKGSYQWLLFRRSQCEDQALNPPSHFRFTSKLPEEMPRWSEVELAQLATFIDCEGCIAIHRNRPASASWSPQYSLRVFVANTYFALVEHLYNCFGGAIQIDPRNEKNPSWRPHYRWWVGSNDALILLELTRPFYIVKGEEVDLAIAFQQRINEYKAGRPRQQGTELAEVEWREQQMRLLQALKHRESYPPADSPKWTKKRIASP